MQMLTRSIGRDLGGRGVPMARNLNAEPVVLCPQHCFPSRFLHSCYLSRMIERHALPLFDKVVGTIRGTRKRKCALQVAVLGVWPLTPPFFVFSLSDRGSGARAF